MELKQGAVISPVLSYSEQLLDCLLMLWFVCHMKSVSVGAFSHAVDITICQSIYCGLTRISIICHRLSEYLLLNNKKIIWQNVYIVPYSYIDDHQPKPRISIFFQKHVYFSFW